LILLTLSVVVMAKVPEVPEVPVLWSNKSAAVTTMVFPWHTQSAYSPSNTVAATSMTYFRSLPMVRFTLFLS
jgi:hypothetical protein